MLFNPVEGKNEANLKINLGGRTSALPFLTPDQKINFPT